jgi:CelD/BcsL family acetyltransferase involved in cellulose biosynthesis
MSLDVRSLALAHVTPAFEQQWLGLVQAAGADLSLTREWFASTVNARGAEQRAHVFAVFDGEQLSGVVPYVERRDSFLSIGLRAWESPGSYLVAYHPEVVAVADTAAVLTAMVRECGSNNDVLVLPNVPVESRTAAAARAVTQAEGLRMLSVPGHSSPYLSITGSWANFVAGKDKKFRYKIRNVRKELEAAGRVSDEWFTGPDRLELFAAQMLEIEAHSWKAAAGMAVSGSDMEQAYYRQLLPFLANRNALRANVLYLDARPIAYSLCYESHGAFRQLKTSFDERCSELSAGSAVLQEAITKAFDSGAREFDFLGDAMLHKNQWSTGVRHHETLYIFLRSWRGRVVGQARALLMRLRRPAPAVASSSKGNH